LKKPDFGQTVTILANIGVIAGIVFLGLELEQNNSLLRMQASYSLLQNRTAFRQEATANAEVADFWVRVNDGDPLSQSDQVRLAYYAETAILNWQFEYAQFLEGNLDEQELPVGGYRAVMNAEGSEGEAYRSVWSRWQRGGGKGSLRADFAQWMSESVVN